MVGKKMKKGFDYIGVSVVYVCHDGHGNILMHKRSDKCRDEHNVWDVGGGALEFGEQVEAAMKREIQEEYGVDVLGYEFINYADVHREHENQKTHWLALIFKVLVDRTKSINGEPDKFEEIAWFRYDNLPKNMHSQLPAFFEKYKNIIF